LPDRVQLVDEHDRRRRFLGLLEEVAHARRAHADDRLDELGCRKREERRVRLPRDRSRQQRLAGPGRPVEEHSARNPRSELAVALGALEEVDDLDQLVLGLVDSGDVLERDPVALTELEPARGRTPEAAEHAAGATAKLAPGEPDEEADQQQGRQEAEQERCPQRPSLVRRLGVDHHLLLGQEIG
jgi:hypothetical protein